MALWLGLTDAALAYVRGTLRPPLVASGVVLLVLAGAALRDGRPATRRRRARPWRPAQRLATGPPGPGAAAGGAPSARLLRRRPPGRTRPHRPAATLAGSSRPCPSRWAEPSPPGQRVRDQGPVRPGPHAGRRPGPPARLRRPRGSRGGYLLTRCNLFCCAADGQAYQLEVRGDGVPAARPTSGWWSRAAGCPSGSSTGSRPRAWCRCCGSTRSRPVRSPADPYEHNLYGL